MSIESNIYKELNRLGFNNLDEIETTEIRNKDGIYLFRITTNKNSYVLKYFINDEYKREIKNYEILKELDVKTIKDYGYTDRAILLEDLKVSKKYRLGVAEDLKDVKVAKALAKWYIELHNKGIDFIKNNTKIYYSEINEITKENIELIILKSGTKNNQVWKLILNNLETIKQKVYSLEQTFNYNDFYWTNLVVSKDKSEAFMFDYNLLGIGPRYSDIRNVCSSLSKEAGESFMKEYGDIDTKEEIIDGFMAPVITLIFAYKREVFPTWGEDCLNSINNGDVEKTVRRILG